MKIVFLSFSKMMKLTYATLKDGATDMGVGAKYCRTIARKCLFFSPFPSIVLKSGGFIPIPPGGAAHGHFAFGKTIFE
jgi:hypothetical protein